VRVSAATADAGGALTRRRAAPPRSNNRAGATGGGAVYTDAGSNATFRDCVVADNVSAGKARSRSSPAAKKHLPLTWPCAPPQGGGVRLEAHSSALLVNVTLAGNDGYFGGGLFADVRTLRRARPVGTTRALTACLPCVCAAAARTLRRR
jgi:hypothetical protein